MEEEYTEVTNEGKKEDIKKEDAKKEEPQKIRTKVNEIPIQIGEGWVLGATRERP